MSQVTANAGRPTRDQKVLTSSTNPAALLAAGDCKPDVSVSSAKRALFVLAASVALAISSCNLAQAHLAIRSSPGLSSEASKASLV